MTRCTGGLLSISSPQLRQDFTVQVAGTPKAISHAPRQLRESI